jgi:hypothetical protein
MFGGDKMASSVRLKEGMNNEHPNANIERLFLQDVFGRMRLKDLQIIQQKQLEIPSRRERVWFIVYLL